MSEQGREFGFDTRAIHAEQENDPTTGAVITPIYATFNLFAGRTRPAQGIRLRAQPQSDAICL